MGRLTAASEDRPEVWAGPECSFLTVGEWVCDQLALTGHDTRNDDLDRLAALGASAVRYPIIWGRSDRAGEVTDWLWAEQRLDGLRQRRIRPIVGLLHHGFGPAAMDPLDPEWPRRFGEYAHEVASRFPETDAWLPINEPLTTARFGALYGWWSPYARDDDTFVRLLVAEAEAYVHAARAIRDVNPSATLIANEDVGRTYGTSECRDAVEHANLRRWLTFDLITGKVDSSHPLWSYVAARAGVRRQLDLLRQEPEPPDVLGIDHYVTSDRYLDHRLERFGRDDLVSRPDIGYADVELARVSGFEVDGFARAIQETWSRYGVPIALTEVHLAGEPADQIAWWAEAWTSALVAARAGVRVVAVTAWSTFGAVDWSSVLRHHAGAYEAGCYDASSVDVRARPLAAVVAATSAGVDPERCGGWWHDAARVLYEVDRIRSNDAARLSAAGRPPSRRRARTDRSRILTRS